MENKDYSKSLRSLGISFKEANETQVVGECPFCGKNKFYFNKTSTKWDCKVCGKTGNLSSLLKQFAEKCIDETEDKFLDNLRKERKIVEIQTLKDWGVFHNPNNSRACVSGYSLSLNISQIYSYVKDKVSGKKFLSIIANGEQKLFGLGKFDEKKKKVIITEGPWDGMVLYELFKRVKKTGKKYTETNNLEYSLLAEYNIISVPGCNVWKENWSELLSGKEVIFIYDSDHPKNNKSPGTEGVKRVVQNLIVKAESKPKAIKYFKWGINGYDPKKPNGYDLRDLISEQGTTIKDRIKAIDIIFSKIEEVPRNWITESKEKNNKLDITSKECKEWDTLIEVWKKALKITDGLDVTLSVMLSVIASIKMPEDQLWIKVRGPASCGKSTLCEALAVSKKYVTPKSIITGFHSGFKTDADGDTDNSLLPTLDGKCLVTKDGDTLLQSENRSKILAEARDIYDRSSSVHYRNNIKREYKNHSMGWIICGTGSLHELDSSELGERFLTCEVQNEISSDLEKEICLRIINRVDYATSENKKTQHTEALLEAMRLTGGYVNYLGDNSQLLAKEITLNEENALNIYYYAKLTAKLRTRPPKTQTETVQSENPGRLAAQMTKLAKCLAIVLNRKSIDNEVMRRIRKVCMDTCKGTIFEAVKFIKNCKTGLYENNIIAYLETKTDDYRKAKILFSMMVRIKIIEVKRYDPYTGQKGSKGSLKFFLTNEIEKLVEKVIENQ